LELRKNWGLEDSPIVDIMRLMEEKGFVISVVKMIIIKAMLQAEAPI